MSVTIRWADGEKRSWADKIVTFNSACVHIHVKVLYNNTSLHVYVTVHKKTDHFALDNKL